MTEKSKKENWGCLFIILLLAVGFSLWYSHKRNIATQSQQKDIAEQIEKWEDNLIQRDEEVVRDLQSLEKEHEYIRGYYLFPISPGQTFGIQKLIETFFTPLSEEYLSSLIEDIQNEIWAWDNDVSSIKSLIEERPLEGNYMAFLKQTQKWEDKYINNINEKITLGQCFIQELLQEVGAIFWVASTEDKDEFGRATEEEYTIAEHLSVWLNKKNDWDDLRSKLENLCNERQKLLEKRPPIIKMMKKPEGG